MALQLIEIAVNGERKQVAQQLSILDLLSQLGVAADRVAVELDKQIVTKKDWASTTIRPGAQIEIVQFVGGG